MVRPAEMLQIGAETIGSVKTFGHLTNGFLRGFKGDVWEAGH